LRIDKLLWFLRFAKTRPLACALVEEGHMRLNGRRIERAHHKVCVGDVLTIPLGGQIAGTVRVIEVLALPLRRGPSSEAQGCYRVLDGGPVDPIAAPQSHDA
jgi:ribosome-associated heat shock protein Hsp15